MSYYDVHSRNEELENAITDEANTKGRVVGKFLYFMGDVLFKNVFSYVAGFEWLLPYTYGLNLPCAKIGLPTISYAVGYPRELATSYVEKQVLAASLGRGNDRLISTFSRGTNNYTINPVNFLPVFLNFIARNLGKLIGYIIASVFTIPAYLLIKSYYGIRKAMAKYRLNTALKRIAPSTLAKEWLPGIYSATTTRADRINAGKLAKYVNAMDFTSGLIDACRSAGSGSFVGAADYQSYEEARKKVLISKRRWALAGTILSGLLLIPLFFTIPAYNNLTRRQDSEKRVLESNLQFIESTATIREERGEEEFKRIIRESTQQKERKRSSSRRSDSFDDEDSQSDEDIASIVPETKSPNVEIEAKYYPALDTFELGKIFLDERNHDAAFIYLSKVPENSPHYTQAMYECGNMLVSIGLHTEAALYMKKSGDQSTILITDALSRNASASVSDVAIRANTTTAPPSAFSSVVSSSVRTVEKKPVLSLDEDEDHTPPSPKV